MPELPEVETIVRGLAPRVEGRLLRAVKVHRPDVVAGEPADRFAAALAGRRVTRLRRRAKWIVAELDEGVLLGHLRMTGRLQCLDRTTPDPPYTALVFHLDDDVRLAYADVRRLGRWRRLSTAAWAAEEAHLGPEPLDEAFTPAQLAARLARSRRPLKIWLLDPRNVAGVGNIYAAEALFRAGLDPRRPAASLAPAEVSRLHAALRHVLTEALTHQGTTFRDYRTADGADGAFRRWLRVYGRAGQPCVVCGSVLERLVQGGRSTVFCPVCQR